MFMEDTMKRLTHHVVPLVLLSGFLVTPAANASESPIYDYFSAYYTLVQLDDDDTGIDFEPNGFGAELSKQFNESMYFIGSYEDVGDDVTVGTFTFDTDLAILTAGVGFKYSASRYTDLFFEPAVVYADANVDDYSEDDTGLSAKVGFTHAVNTAFHFKGFLRHLNVMDTETNSYGAEARILFSPAFHGILGAEANSDEKFFRAGFSLRF